MSERINESFLVRQGEQAQAQLEQMQTVIAQRGSAAVGTVSDGLAYLVVSARGGDISARRALRSLAQLLKEVELIGAIALPGD